MPRQNAMFWRINDLPYGYTNSFHLFNATKNSRDILRRLRIQVKIPAHSGCVNSICWNESGQYLLSGSDDHHLCLTDAYTYNVLTYVHTGHKSNIFSAKFLPSTGDHKVVSCSGDGVIIYSDLEYPETSQVNKFSCHFGTAYEIMTIPNDPNSFLSCGEDGTVRWFDLRSKTLCSKDKCKEDILINCQCPTSALSVNPLMPYQLSVGCSDASVRIYDRRLLGTPATGARTKNSSQAQLANFTVPEFTSSHRITSLGYSHDGQELLVSYSSDCVYLFDIGSSLRKSSKVLRTGNDNLTNSSKNPLKDCSLMKRVRVRGDWSDTGPEARPESDGNGATPPRSVHACLMQRMSNMLTNLYNQRPWSENTGGGAPVSSSSSHSGGSETEENENHYGDDSGAADNNLSYSVHNLNHNDKLQPSTSCSNTRELASDPDGTNLIDSDPVQSDFSPADVGFSSTNIQVPSFPPDDQTSMEQNESEYAPNLSLINLKQELSSVSRGLLHNTNNEELSTKKKSVRKLASEDVKRQAETSQNHSSSTCPQFDRQQLKSSQNICDEQKYNRSSFSVHDPRVSTSSSTFKEDSVPIVSVASNSSSDESLSDVRAVTHQCPVSLVMEMNSWDVESEDEASLPLYQSSGETQAAVKEVVAQNSASKEEDGDDEFIDDEDTFCETFALPEIKKKYSGHRNSRTMIKESTFWGDNFIMSGSDCGHIFVWDRHTAQLAMLFEADHHVVNCVQPHPFDPILASSGIDYDIKIWAPLREEPIFDKEKAQEIMKRNEIMLEETKDTITVPASFMLRMLVSLNHMTSESGWSRAVRRVRENVRERNNR